METKYLVDLDQEAIENAATRVPVCLCVDASGSMGKVVSGDTRFTGETIYEDGREWEIVDGGTSRMELLVEGLKTFKKEVQNDIVANRAVDLCVVSFNDEAHCIFEYGSIDHFDIGEVRRKLEPKGETELGEGILLALDKLEDRKRLYKINGIDYYQPILVIFSDGENTGNYNKLNLACERVQSLAAARRLSCFQVGIDEESNLNELTRINPRREAKGLKSVKFNEFFIWLSKSTGVLSRSSIGEMPKLPPSDSWSTF